MEKAFQRAMGVIHVSIFCTVQNKPQPTLDPNLPTAKPGAEMLCKQNRQQVPQTMGYRLLLKCQT